MSNRYRIVECINVIWECEAASEKEAVEKYWKLVEDPREFQRLTLDGTSDVEVIEIDKNGDAV